MNAACAPAAMLAGSMQQKEGGKMVQIRWKMWGEVGRFGRYPLVFGTQQRMGVVPQQIPSVLQTRVHIT